MSTKLLVCTTLAITIVADSTSAHALTPEEIVNYRGTDRQQVLLDGARKEGQVVLYSALIVNQMLRPLAAGFMKKYPFIKMTYYRADSEELLAKLSAETRANNVVADVFEGSGGGEIDPAFTLAKDVLGAADTAGFDLCLYAERHLGADFEAWMLAAAISSWTRNIRAMPAVHPGLWHPTLIAKMASCLDRLTTGRMAVNVVTGWNEVEARMYGGDILLHEDDRYIRAEEFIRVLRGMWSETPFSLDGQFYQVKESQLLLKPATTSPPEIFTASRSERGLEMVAYFADWSSLA